MRPKRKKSKNLSRKGSDSSIPGDNPTKTEKELEFSLKEIEKEVQTNKKYETEKAKFYPWSPNHYLCQIDMENFKYLGVINSKMQREGVGINHFENGDIYLGKFKDDFMNSHGFYAYKPKEEGDKRLSEYYWGFWENGKKEGKGAYLWLTEDKNNIPFKDSGEDDFDIFYGTSKNNHYKNGLYLSKKGSQYTAYLGDFDDNGKKTGDNSFFYDPEREILLYGKIENDNYISAYVTHFDSNGNILETIQCEFEEDGKVKSSTQRENIQNVEEIERKMHGVRNVLMAVDVFGDFHQQFKDSLEFIQKIKIIECFNEENYPKVNDFTANYNEFKILSDLQRAIE